MILSGHKVPKCSKRAFGQIYRPIRPKKCWFGKIWQHIFSSITSKVHGSRAAPLNGQNEGRIFEKNRIFRVCFRAQTRTRTEDKRAQQPPPHAGKSHPVGGLRTPHSNKVSTTAGAGKNCYFIIFSLRTCLGCARHASSSVPFWCVLGVFGSPGGPWTP